MAAPPRAAASLPVLTLLCRERKTSRHCAVAATAITSLPLPGLAGLDASMMICSRTIELYHTRRRKKPLSTSATQAARPAIYGRRCAAGMASRFAFAGGSSGFDAARFRAGFALATPFPRTYDAYCLLTYRAAALMQQRPDDAADFRPCRKSFFLIIGCRATRSFKAAMPPRCDGNRRHARVASRRIFTRHECHEAASGVKIFGTFRDSLLASSYDSRDATPNALSLFRRCAAVNDADI